MAKKSITLNDMIANVDNLSPRQLQQLITKIQRAKGSNKDNRLTRLINIDLENEVKALGLNNACPNCGSKIIVSNGRRENGIQRLKCTNCGKQFTYFTDTILEKTKYSWEMWIEFIYLMLTNSSLEHIKAVLINNYNCPSISSTTVFNWRMKILEAAKAVEFPKLTGIIEVDETFIHEGQKGSLELVDPFDTTQTRNARKKGKPSKYGTMGPEFGTIACAVDRSGHTIAKYIGVGAMNTNDFAQNIIPYCKDITFLCSDANSVYESYCKTTAIFHYVRPSNYVERLILTKGDDKIATTMYRNQELDYITQWGTMKYTYNQFKKIRNDNELSLARVNQFHDRIKLELVKKTRGISLKNIDNYVAWLCLLINFKVDYGHIPASRKDAETIFKMLLCTKKNISIKNLVARKPVYTHLQKRYVNRLVKTMDDARAKKNSTAYYITAEEQNPNFNLRDFLDNLPVYMIKFLADECKIPGRSKIKVGSTRNAKMALIKHPDIDKAIMQLRLRYGKTKEE